MTYSAHIEVFEYKLYCPIHVVQKKCLQRSVFMVKSHHSFPEHTFLQNHIKMQHINLYPRFLNKLGHIYLFDVYKIPLGKKCINKFPNYIKNKLVLK